MCTTGNSSVSPEEASATGRPASDRAAAHDDPANLLTQDTFWPAPTWCVRRRHARGRQACSAGLAFWAARRTAEAPWKASGRSAGCRSDFGGGVPKGRLDALADERVAAVEALSVDPEQDLHGVAGPLGHRGGRHAAVEPGG